MSKNNTCFIHENDLRSRIIVIDYGQKSADVGRGSRVPVEQVASKTLVVYGREGAAVHVKEGRN